MRYLTGIPKKVPEGQVVVHNRVIPTKRLGVNGFRAWLEAPNDRLVRCNCDWAAGRLDVHYRYPISEAALAQWTEAQHSAGAQ